MLSFIKKIDRSQTILNKNNTTRMGKKVYCIPTEFLPDAVKFITLCTHPGIVETKSIEWQLEIEIFVNLRHRSVYVFLIISQIVATASIKEPVHLIASNLS
jgi:hypothetical protein